MQRDNWHFFTGAIWQNTQIRLLWISNRHNDKTFHYLVTELFYTCLTNRVGSNYILAIWYNFCWHMQCFDDATTFSHLQVLFLYFFPKFSGFLAMACKKTLILIDMHSTKIFTPPCISTQNMLCKVMLTLLHWPCFVVFKKMFE